MLIKFIFFPSSYQGFLIRDRLQISILILYEFKEINRLLFALKSPENLWFSDGLEK